MSRYRRPAPASLPTVCKAVTKKMDKIGFNLEKWLWSRCDSCVFLGSLPAKDSATYPILVSPGSSQLSLILRVSLSLLSANPSVIMYHEISWHTRRGFISRLLTPLEEILQLPPQTSFSRVGLIGQCLDSQLRQLHRRSYNALHMLAFSLSLVVQALL